MQAVGQGKQRHLKFRGDLKCSYGSHCLLPEEGGALKEHFGRGQGLHGAQVLAWHGPLCPASLSLPPSATAQDLKKLLPPTPRAGQGVHLHCLGNSNLSF